jgi:uncharacterized membrane protein
MTEIRTQDRTPEISPQLPEKLSEMTASLTLHAGPLPSPEMVERYELVLPGAFDRILTMAEKEQQAGFEHNRSGWFFAHCGQVFGFAVVVIYFVILGMTVWFNNTAMFVAVFSAGAVAGLPSLVRSFQSKNGKK